MVTVRRRCCYRTLIGLQYVVMEEIMHIAFDVLADAIKDTLYIIPFLFVTYLAMEWL